MFVSPVISYSRCGLIIFQSQLRNRPETIFHETEKYHAAGIVEDGDLSLFPYRQNDPQLLQPLIKNNLDVGHLNTILEDTAFHVYFAETDYPILYTQTYEELYFFLSGSSINYSRKECTHNPEVFSRVSANYFGGLLTHDKPLNEIFRDFQFNGIGCGDVTTIRMDGVSLGSGMEHFLLVYILQNIQMFNNLQSIELNIVSPACFHPKIIASLNKQFNDALLKIHHPLIIAMNYTMHLKDSIVRRGNPFALQYTGKPEAHNVVYSVEIYAYCDEEKCNHKIKNILSDEYACDIVPSNQQYRKYHTTRPTMQEYKIYEKFKTSDFGKIQNLIDKYFPSEDHCFKTFKQFFFNAYGDDVLQHSDVHAIIYAHENLAHAMFKKYKLHTVAWDNNAVCIHRKIGDLEKIHGIRELKTLAKKGFTASSEQCDWNFRYLELCDAKYEFTKLVLAKSIEN